MSTLTPREIATAFIVEHGWSPIPIPHREKNPGFDGWQNMRITIETVADHFNGRPQNIGVLLGEPSGGLSDVDMDCDEAAQLASHFLPPTLNFGRASRRQSHRLFISRDAETRQFRDVDEVDGKDGPMLVELRSTGTQTVFPYSTHKETGEQIEFDLRDGSPRDPMKIEASELTLRVTQLAIATLLVRHGFSEADAVAAAHDWERRGVDVPPALARRIGKWMGVTPAHSSANTAPHTVDLATRIERARKYVAKMPAAVSGRGGHASTWNVALVLVRGFDLPREAAYALLDEYNKRCEPPWSDAELAHKLEDAAEADAERGYLLRADRIEIAQSPNLAKVTDDLASALASSADANLYQRHGLLVRLVDVRRAAGDIDGRGACGKDGIRRPEGAPQIQVATLPAVRETVARICRFTKLNKDDVKVEVPTPRDVVEMFAARGSWDLPILEAVAEAPRLRPDGSVIQRPGLDVSTGVFYRPCANYPLIPEQPTRDDALAALEALDHPLADFAFEEQHHRSAALAAILTVAAGPAIQGPRPMFEFGGRTPGVGKGLLAGIVSTIGAGRAPACMAPPRDDEEARKTILALALDGTQVILIDNATGLVGTPSLAMALTAGEVSGRVLGATRIATVPISATWFVTGNGLSYTADLGRRVVPVMQDAGVEHPEDRGNWRVPDLKEYVKRERARLTTAALTVLRAHAVAGRPQHGGARKGSFESWDDIVRSALLWLGRADPLGGVVELREQADADRDALDQLLRAWAQEIGSKPITAAELTTHVLKDWEGGGLRSALSSLASELNARGIGLALRSIKGRLVNGRRLVSLKKTDHGVPWLLEQVRQGG